jgi:hypothetical protein
MSVSRQKRIALWERDQRACHYCGAGLAYEEMTLDHVVPKAFGGPPTFWNLVCSCIDCNHKLASAVRKCECDVCARALEQYLQERENHKPIRPGWLQTPMPGKARQRLRSRSLETAIEEIESRLQSLTEVLLLLPDGDEHTHHAAAMRGKLNGLREALDLLSTVEDQRVREAS